MYGKFIWLSGRKCKWSQNKKIIVKKYIVRQDVIWSARKIILMVKEWECMQKILYTVTIFSEEKSCTFDIHSVGIIRFPFWLKLKSNILNWQTLDFSLNEIFFSCLTFGLDSEEISPIGGISTQGWMKFPSGLTLA